MAAPESGDPVSCGRSPLDRIQPGLQLWPHFEIRFVTCDLQVNLFFLYSVLCWITNEYTWLKSESESCSVMPDSLWPHGLYIPWNSPGQNTGVGSLSLLQGIFPTQGSNPGFPHCMWILYQLSYQGSPRAKSQLAGLPLICTVCNIILMKLILSLTRRWSF